MVKFGNIISGSLHSVVYGYSASLSEATWSEIDTISSLGVADDYWSVGDTKNITLTTAETLTTEIVGFNHDDLTSGEKAGITFGMKNLMANTRQMNSTNTNVGGYTGSAMYNWLTGTLYNQLPSDLRAVMKTVNKKTSAGNCSLTINTNAMNIFLFSEIEVFGSTNNSASGEGTRYSRFSNSSSRVKRLSNGSGSAVWWWLRSPYRSHSSYFCGVTSDGYANNTNAHGANGVCFGFCV